MSHFLSLAVWQLTASNGGQAVKVPCGSEQKARDSWVAAVKTWPWRSVDTADCIPCLSLGCL